MHKNTLDRPEKTGPLPNGGQTGEAESWSLMVNEPMQPIADFDPKAAAKKLLREGRGGALATLMPGSGDPYCSLVNVATAADGAPLLLISRLAVHTKNILADPRASLLLDERKPGNPLQGARIMLMGTSAPTQDPQV